MSNYPHLDLLPDSWRDLLRVIEAVFRQSAVNPHDGRRYERPADANIDFAFDPDPGVWARIEPCQDRYSVRLSLGAYLRIHGLTFLFSKTKNRIKLLNADRCIDTPILSQQATRIFEAKPKTLTGLIDLLQDIFRIVGFEEPIEEFSFIGSESGTAALYGLYFLVFHEFAHYWNGHFSLQSNPQLANRIQAALAERGSGSVWRTAEVQADMSGGESVADLVLAAPDLQDYVANNQAVGVKNFIYHHSQLAGLAIFSALDLLDTMNPHYADRQGSHEHIDLRREMTNLAYLMYTKASFNDELGFVAFEALHTAATTYVGTLFQQHSDERRATRLDPTELGFRMYDFFQDLGIMSEMLFDYTPGGVPRGMREAGTFRTENFPKITDAPDTPFFRAFKGANFEAEVAAYEKLLKSRTEKRTDPASKD